MYSGRISPFRFLQHGLDQRKYMEVRPDFFVKKCDQIMIMWNVQQTYSRIWSGAGIGGRQEVNAQFFWSKIRYQCCGDKTFPARIHVEKVRLFDYHKVSYW